MTPLLDPHTINAAEQLGLAARFVVDGYMAGEHKSPFKGFSVEFTQHREYSPGDDTRRLDWKVLARTDRYFLKQYEQETNFVAHLIVDGSESMQYCSGKDRVVKKHPPAAVSKFDYARAMAACLAYLILRQRDAISVELFDTQSRQLVPRTGTLAGLGNVMTTISAFTPTGPTNIGDVLHSAVARIKRRGIVILISDLLDDESKILDGIQHMRFAGHEVIVFHTMDPYEWKFPFGGNVEFDGFESAGPSSIDTVRTRPAEVRNSYLAELNRFQSLIRQGCEKNQTHYVPVDTGHSLKDVLTGYLVGRGG